MAKKQIFFSFHFDNDFWRTQQVRNMGAIEGNTLVSANDWEELKRKGDKSIENWIDDSLKYKNCTIVLIGSQTSQRYWVKQEIIKSWNAGKGVMGIHIHNLKDSDSKQSSNGSNPFSSISINSGKTSLSSIVPVYDPPYTDSKDVYGYISDNIENWIENAIATRKLY